MTPREEQPLDFAQQISVQAVPASTLIVAGAMYIIVVALIAWNLTASIETSKALATLNGSYNSDVKAIDRRLDSMETRQNSLDGRIVSLERTR